MKHQLSALILFYLRFFARRALARHTLQIIGIAGSVGKSSTRNAVEAILKDHFSVLSVGNSETGIPLGILGLNPSAYSLFEWIRFCALAPFRIDHIKGVKYLITEMGIDDPYPPKNMSYLLSILKPDIALSLNISATHTEQFEKILTHEDKSTLSPASLHDKVLDAIGKEDTKIITESGCSVGIYNADDLIVTRYVKTSPTPLLSFGKSKVNDISYISYTVSPKGTIFVMHDNKEKQDIILSFPMFLLPEVYREVLAAAILTTKQTGLTQKQITTSLQENFSLPKGRSSLFHGIHETLLIDSTYNASQVATTAFLDLVEKLKNDTKRLIVFVFGDMRELGAESEQEHIAVAKKLVGTVDYLYLVGPQTREYVLPYVQDHEYKFTEIRWFDSAKRVGEFLKDSLPKKAIVLFKGSQNTIYLEEAIKYVLTDKTDAKKLCRQDPYWLKRKQGP